MGNENLQNILEKYVREMVEEKEREKFYDTDCEGFKRSVDFEVHRILKKLAQFGFDLYKREE